MKKRLLAGFLSLVMVLSLLPATALAATGTAGVANVYTLADIKAATGDYSVTTIRLMNDIDANKESISYYRSSDYTTVADSLRQGVTLDGQGHTIYNLKTTLLRVNAGTIKNLNTTVHDTPEDSERLVYHMTAQYSGAQVNISGIAVQNHGTIESCNTLFTLEGERSQVTFRLSGITAYNDGTIRDCIASYDVDYHIKNGGAWLTGAASFAGLAYSNSGLIDHSLVLGSVIVSGDAYCSDAIGLTNMSQCTDSACALERLSLTCNDEIDFSPAFQTYTGSTAGAKNCRVAADLQVTNISEKKNIHESGTVSGGKGYTLASRDSILKDWDLSGVPGGTPSGGGTTTDPKPTTPEIKPPAPTPEPTPEPEPEPEKNPFPEGTANFYYSASDGTTRQHYFYYNDLMFYSFDETYRYQSTLAKASLCLAMSAFTNCENEVWDINLATQDHRRAYNVQRLYQTLGFTNDQYYNYDKALTDTSDKVAFSIAMKYIDDGEGNTDTLIAIPLRGGGYGGEWGSNFNITYQNYNQNHVGFQRAANGVRSELAAYLGQLQQSGKIKGSVKLWITGYSRSAATANILAHDVSALTSLGGVSLSRKNIYAYTFATPAGAKNVLSNWDSNIFNIVSPVDIVPKVAPSQWKYSRYGTTLLLPMENSADLINTYKELSGEEGSYAELAILGEVQQLLLDVSTDRLFSYIPDSDAYYDRGLNETLSTGLGKLLGCKPSDKDPTGLITLLNGISDVGSFFDDPIKKAVLNQLTAEGANIGRAHHPELYLARLETGKLNTEADFTRNFNGKEIVVPLDKTLPGVTGGGANGKLDITIYDRNHQVVGSYQNGVCKSGSVAVNKTCMGVVFSLPDSSGDYTLSVRSGAESTFSFSAYTYDRAHTDGPARIVDFSDYPMSAGDGYTYTIPGGTTGKYLGRSTDGLEECNPDYDSQSDGNERSLDDHIPLNFTDVPADAYFRDAVEWAVGEGITGGTSATTFSPYNVCTRAQAVTFLWRADGSPKPESARSPFTDVKAGSYYYDAVLWAVEQGITSGTTPTTFSPDATCTRGQIVTFLYHSWGDPEVETRASFRDVPAGAYYAEPVNWAADWGVTGGTSATTFSPNAFCTRAQIVTFLYRSYFG